jgi:hypothetical protein
MMALFGNRQPNTAYLSPVPRVREESLLHCLDGTGDKGDIKKSAIPGTRLNGLNHWLPSRCSWRLPWGYQVGAVTAAA